MSSLRNIKQNLKGSQKESSNTLNVSSSAVLQRVNSSGELVPYEVDVVVGLKHDPNARGTASGVSLPNHMMYDNRVRFHENAQKAALERKQSPVVVNKEHVEVKELVKDVEKVEKVETKTKEVVKVEKPVTATTNKPMKSRSIPIETKKKVEKVDPSVKQQRSTVMVQQPIILNSDIVKLNTPKEDKVMNLQDIMNMNNRVKGNRESQDKTVVNPVLTISKETNNNQSLGQFIYTKLGLDPNMSQVNMDQDVGVIAEAIIPKTIQSHKQREKEQIADLVKQLDMEQQIELEKLRKEWMDKYVITPDSTKENANLNEAASLQLARQLAIEDGQEVEAEFQFAGTDKELKKYELALRKEYAKKIAFLIERAPIVGVKQAKAEYNDRKNGNKTEVVKSKKVSQNNSFSALDF